MFSKKLSLLSRTTCATLTFMVVFSLFSCAPAYVSEHNADPSDAVNQSTGLDADWYKKSNFYHIWIKSFCDSDGDGCGDFKGIESKLDYINDTLGCDTIWLSPFMECSYGKGKAENYNMHGYDVVDFYAVNNYYAAETYTNEKAEADLIDLINACHAKGMKIIFDFVPNHTSWNNQWFIDSINKVNDKDSWYVWKNTSSVYNYHVFTGMSGTDWWHFDNLRTGESYYAAFANYQPDLNYNNSEVREEMKNVARYWLNKGFDGLRVDAVRYILEEGQTGVDTDSTHAYLKELRTEVKKYSSPKLFMAETWITENQNLLDSYFGASNKKEFDVLLNFNVGTTLMDCVKKGTDSLSALSNVNNPTIIYGEGYATFLGNHDNYRSRLGTEMEGNVQKEKLVTALSLMHCTIPVIYYGQEIGMADNTSYGDGDIRLRCNYDWSSEAEQESDTTSLLSINNALIKVRNAYPDLFAYGKLKVLNSNSTSAIAYTLSYGDDTLLCVFNLTGSAADVAASTLSESAYSPILYAQDDSSAASGLTWENEKVTSASVPAYGFRVYYIGDNTKANIYGAD